MTASHNEHQIIDGTEGSITGKGGDQDENDDAQWRNSAMPDQSSQGGSGHIRQPVGGTGKGKTEFQLSEARVRGWYAHSIQ